MEKPKSFNWKNLAIENNFTIEDYGNGEIFFFPSSWKNGWIAEMRPNNDLSVSSAWFTPEEDIIYKIESHKNFICLLCIDTGKIILNQQGRKTKILNPITNIIVNEGSSLKFTFKKGEFYCFTSVIICEDFINNSIRNLNDPPKITVNDAKQWNSEHINTPNIMLIMEQIRWAVRNKDISLLAYEAMVIHLLTSIERNFPEIEKRRLKRRHYVTWENEQQVYKVKELIDSDILNTPTIDNLSILAEMSESKLRESFKNLYNIPIYSYIRRETMKKAMQLLASDDLSIKNISQVCGFKNPSKFTEAFKDIHGITPSEFRKSFNL